jgi:hypothetical protein
LFGAFIINVEISTNRLTHTSRKIGTYPTITSGGQRWMRRGGGEEALHGGAGGNGA